MRDYALELDGKGILPREEESLEDYVERAEDRMNQGYKFQEEMDLDSLKSDLFVKGDPESIDLSEEAEWLDERYDIDPDWIPGFKADLKRNMRGYAKPGEEEEYVVVDNWSPKSTRRHEMLHVTRHEDPMDMKSFAIKALKPWKGYYSEEEVAIDELARSDTSNLENWRVQGINVSKSALGFMATAISSKLAFSLPTPFSELTAGFGATSGLICMKGVASIHEASRMQRNLLEMRGKCDEILVRLNADELNEVAERHEDDTAEALSSYVEEQEGLKFEFIQDRYSDLLE